MTTQRFALGVDLVVVELASEELFPPRAVDGKEFAGANLGVLEFALLDPLVVDVVGHVEQL